MSPARRRPAPASAVGPLILPAVPGIGDSLLYTPPPDQLSPGPDVWLKADAIVGLSDNDPVATWENLGTGADFAQATAGKRPIYKPGIQNGRAGVRFQGTDDCLTAAITLSGPTGWTIFVVCGSMSGGATQMLLESSANFNNNNGTFAIARSTTDKLETNIRGVTTVHAVTSASVMGAPAICTLWSDQANQHVHEVYGYLNGESSLGGVHAGNYGSPVSASYTNQTWHLGARNDGASLPATVDIFEVVAYSWPLSVAQRRGIERYLAAKWGATLTHAPWVIFGTGHSHMRGAAEQPAASALPFLKQLVGLKSQHAFDAINLGLDGQECDEMIVNDPAKLDHHLTNLDARALLLTWAIANDMGAIPPHDDQTAAVAISRLTQYCSDRRAAGWAGRHKIVVLEEPPQTVAVKGATWEARRTEANEDMHGLVPTYLDDVVPIQANATIGPEAAASDPTYYFAAQGHPTATCHGIIAQEVDAILDLFGIV
jgi:hypothetical protein